MLRIAFIIVRLCVNWIDIQNALVFVSMLCMCSLAEVELVRCVRTDECWSSSWPQVRPSCTPPLLPFLRCGPRAPRRAESTSRSRGRSEAESVRDRSGSCPPPRWSEWWRTWEEFDRAVEMNESERENIECEREVRDNTRVHRVRHVATYLFALSVCSHIQVGVVEEEQSECWYIWVEDRREQRGPSTLWKNINMKESIWVRSIELNAWGECTYVGVFVDIGTVFDERGHAFTAEVMCWWEEQDGYNWW